MPTGLSAAIGELRKQRKMSLRALAAKARLPLATVRDLESGRVSNPGVFTVAAAARALGATVDQLLGEAFVAADRQAHRDIPWLRMQIAVHESGHAVVALRLGVPFYFVTLDDPYREKVAGYVAEARTGAYRWGASKRGAVFRIPGWSEHENLITVCVAGRIAEERWCAEHDGAPSRKTPTAST